MDTDLKTDVDRVGRIATVPLILRVVCQVTGMGFAAVARVTEDRWIACSVLDRIEFGLKPGGELKVETTICSEIRRSRQAVVIDHVAEDDDFCGHPTPAMYGFQSYISVPIVLKDGEIFGTLCAIDPRPARLRFSDAPDMFALFANLIGSHLSADAEHEATREALVEERHDAELREQFVAILGHDLRNPIAAVGSGIDLLAKSPASERDQRILAMMRTSLRRASDLVDTVMDFARVRLGGGFKIAATPTLLQPVVQSIVSEMQASHPKRVISVDVDIAEPLLVDGVRIGQLLSNLVANALQHGPADAPVRVGAHVGSREFALWVENDGGPIPSDVTPRLFAPFARGERASSKGLGLGLYIASEVARSHGGTLSFTSSAAETRFTFVMPIAAAS